MSRNGSGAYSLPSGNPVVPSTVISSTWANNTLSDIATALTQSIANDGQTTPVANLPMATFRHTNVGNAVARTDYAAAGQVQDSSLQWLTSIAGTDTITASITPSPSAYVAGQTFRFTSVGANTTAAVTLNINGLGAKSLTKSGTTALSVGDIPSGAIISVTYDGTRFQVIGVTAFTASSGPGNSPFGIRNKLINSLCLLNQRGYVSGAATTGANQYTIDRWRVVVSGQNISYVNGGGFGIVTAPAGGVEQPISADEIDGGTYYLTWVGTATATVNGTPVTNGGSIAITANTQVTVRFISGTFDHPQFEIGGITPYQHIDSSIESLRAFRYAFGEGSNSGGISGVSTATGATVSVKFPATMRATPTYTHLANGTLLDGLGGLATTNSSGTANGGTSSGRIDVVAAGTTAGRGAVVVGLAYLWSAEI